MEEEKIKCDSQILCCFILGTALCSSIGYEPARFLFSSAQIIECKLVVLFNYLATILFLDEKNLITLRARDEWMDSCRYCWELTRTLNRQQRKKKKEYLITSYNYTNIFY